MVAFWVGWALQHEKHGWQWTVAAQCVPAVFLFLGLIFLPASPRWLAQRGRSVVARDNLIALGRTAAAAYAELAEIDEAIREERNATSVVADPLFVQVRAHCCNASGVSTTYRHQRHHVL